MKIIINTPDLRIPGGVASHYKGLKNFWNEDVYYNFIGSRKLIPGFLVLPTDLIKFIFKIILIRPDVVLLNPSLAKKALWRDFLFLKISKWHRIKTFIFIHGWDVKEAQNISNSPSSFALKINQADGILVLAKSFEKKLLLWGVTSPIFRTSTKVDDFLLKKFEMNSKIFNKTILFLARIEENKGILIALEAFNIVRLKIPEIKLLVAGTGTGLIAAREYVKTNGIEGVEFLGNLAGENLIQAFTSSSIYILPTTHGEGMPTSVLEAMAFGLPIISRPVGGLVDFFEQEKMGWLIKTLNPEEYAARITELFEDPTLLNTISNYNHRFATENFMASKIAIKIEKIVRS